MLKSKKPFFIALVVLFIMLSLVPAVLFIDFLHSTSSQTLYPEYWAWFFYYIGLFIYTAFIIVVIGFFNILFKVVFRNDKEYSFLKSFGLSAGAYLVIQFSIILLLIVLSAVGDYSLSSAKRAGNAGLCLSPLAKLTQDRYAINACITVAAERSGDPVVCSMLLPVSPGACCYAGSICHCVGTPKGDCLVRVAVSKNDSAVCNLIEDWNFDKERCNSRATG